MFGGAFDASAPALIDAGNGETWDYARLSAAVDAVAGAFERPDKSLVFCLCRNDPATVIAYLAALEAGHAVMLLDAAVRGDVLADLVARYRPEIVGGSTALSGAVIEALSAAYGAPRVERGVTVAARCSTSGGFINPDLDVLLSTSGTTGSPKFVRLAGGAVSANALSIAAALSVSPSDRAVTSLPLHYSYGLSVLNSHLASGACIVLTEHGPLDRQFWGAVREFGCTSFAGVPYSYQILERIGFDRFDLPGLETMTQAGGKLDAGRVERFHKIMAKRGGRFFVMYGQTEATARIAVLPPELLLDKVGSAGRAIPGGRLEIEVEGVSASGPGTAGEIVYSGANVMMGYATERRDLSRGDELGGRLHTGDIGYLDGDGCLFVTGRSKRISKVGGYRVDLDDVEAHLAVNGPTAVTGTDDLIVAYCEFGDEDSLQQLRIQLSRALSLHHQSIRLVRIDALPRTSSGKIDYGSLEVPGR